MIEIVALCHSCHNYIHRGRLEILWQQGKVSDDMYADIINHGDTLISKLKSRKNPFIATKPEDGVADWDKWHLIIEGKKYYSKFKDMDEWMNYYAR